MWRVAASVSNKQSRTADKWWSLSFGVGRGAKNFSPLAAARYTVFTHTAWLTHCREQSQSWEVNSHSSSQEALGLFMEPEGSLRVHKNPSLVPILRQKNPVYNSKYCFTNINSNIIFPSTPRSSTWSFPFKFSNQNFVCISHLYHACHMSCYLILIDLIILVIFVKAYKLWSSRLPPFPPS